jgi:peptide/nickel transport system permease protein
MVRTAAKVLLRIIPVLIVVSIATALLIQLLPGDPAVAIAGPDASPEQYAVIRESLGLNEPLFTRYIHWLGGFLQGDLGKTLAPPVQDVSTMIAARLPVTLELAILASALSLAIAIPVGAWSAYRLGRGFDNVATFGSFALISLPSFLLALLLIYFVVFNQEAVKGVILGVGLIVAFSFAWGAIGVRGKSLTAAHRRRRWIVAAAVLAVAALLIVLLPDFPRQGFTRITEGGLIENLRSVFLPVLTLALAESAQLTRLLRNDMATTLQDDFVLAARAKGMPVRHILVKEALRPSSFSLITVAGISLGRLIGGTVIVETIFRLPGMGTLIVDAVAKKEFLVLQASVLVVAGLYVLINALVDISYLYLDPRTRHARA